MKKIILDGRQITDSNSVWRPSMLQNKNKRSRASNPPVCPYCKSTFASGNNLRRHIVEVHKRNEAKQMRENGVAETQFIEKELECQACGITFSNRSEWVEHKITHARTMKPSTTYEWGCDICGKIFTRKERLLVHMLSHMSNEEEKLAARKSDGFESNSQSSMSSQSQSHQSRSQQSMDSNNVKIEAGEKTTISLLKQPQSLLKQQTTQNSSLIVPKSEKNEEKKIIMKLSIPTKVDFDADDSNSSNERADQPTCDICQGQFKSEHELRQHIKTHIHEKGPEMNLNEDVRDSDPDSDGEEDYGDYDDHEIEQNNEKQHVKAGK